MFVYYKEKFEMMAEIQKNRCHPQYEQVVKELGTFFKTTKAMIDDNQHAKMKVRFAKHLTHLQTCDPSQKFDTLIELIIQSCHKVIERPMDVGKFIEAISEELNQISGIFSLDKDPKIRKLERQMLMYKRDISRLEKMEVRLDNEDSVYLKIDVLMRKCLKNHQEVCKLTNLDPSLGWKRDKHFHTESSRIPLVNERIMDLINVKKETPDFIDIFKIFKDVNLERNLGYAPQAIKDLGKLVF